MSPKPRKSLALYLAGAGALSAASAHGAVVIQTLNATLTDPDVNSANPTSTLATIQFDGTSILLTNSSADPGIQISADDKSGLTVTDGTRTTAGGYLQTSNILAAGEVVATGFATTPAPGVFTTAATDQFIGVSTPTGQLGWVHFSVTANGGTVTIQDVAFQTNPGDSIAAGTTIPEPASAGLLALAGGLAVLRRRRMAA